MIKDIIIYNRLQADPLPDGTQRSRSVRSASGRWVSCRRGPPPPEMIRPAGSPYLYCLDGGRRDHDAELFNGIPTGLV